MGLHGSWPLKNSWIVACDRWAIPDAEDAHRCDESFEKRNEHPHTTELRHDGMVLYRP